MEVKIRGDGIIFIKSLLRFCGDDFELYESIEHTLTYYKISIEGYMGFENMSEIVELYKEFLVKLEGYLIENNRPKTEKHLWKCIYQTRAIDVCHDHDCYWFFLEPYKSTEIWDTYYYMEDVIKQLSEIKEELIHI